MVGFVPGFPTGRFGLKGGVARFDAFEIDGGNRRPVAGGHFLDLHRRIFCFSHKNTISVLAGV